MTTTVLAPSECDDGFPTPRQFQIDAQPGAEAKCVFSVHPRGNQYGWSNN